MDTITEPLARYACELSAAAIPDHSLHEMKRRFVDSIACAIGAHDSGPARITQGLASRAGTNARPATVWTTGTSSTWEAAAFANCVMTRYLDFNDIYLGAHDAGHPSDMLPAVFAVAEGVGASGADLLLAAIASYEGFGPFVEAMPLKQRGFDHGLWASLGTAVAAGKLLGLDVIRMTEAISLAVSPNVPIRQTRSGELSAWKGCATAASCRSGLFAAVLAEAGMPGPTRPFDGRQGILDGVATSVGAPTFGGIAGKAFAVDETHLKSVPVEYHLQPSAEGAIRIRRRVEPSELAALRVTTYEAAYSETARDPERWDPKTRETADHSMPYVIAAALADGAVTIRSFDDDRIGDPALRDLIKKLTIVESDELSAAWPPQMTTVFEATTTAGERVVEQVEFPRGHAMNPMTDDELADKFAELVHPVVGEARGGELLDLLWHLDELESLDSIVARTMAA